MDSTIQRPYINFRIKKQSVNFRITQSCMDSEGEKMSDCVQTLNILCKHIESNDTYYVDLEPLLGTSETVSSITSVTPSDATLTAGTGAVLSISTTVTRYERDTAGNTTTTTYVIAANKGASFTLTGGATGAGCSTVTVKFVKSTGKTDAVDCLVEVHGVDV